MKNSLFLAILLIASMSGAFASDSLSYSGRLVNANGSPVTGPVDLRFDFVYTNATSSILCTQLIPNVTLTNGVFHTKLDPDCSAASSTMTGVLANVPLNESLAIRVTDETHSKAYSYQALHSMPFANIAKQLDKLGATNGQVLTWNGTKWAPTTPSTATGSVTTISTGAGLTGGPITASGTIAIADAGVTDIKIASGISRTKLANGTANSVVINSAAGALSDVAQLPVLLGGTGANSVAGARTNLGLGTAAIANIGTGIGNVMGADAVPVCLAFEKLQMSAGPVYAWSCVADYNTPDATKLPLAGGTMSGPINMGAQLITNLATPTAAGHAATKAYVDGLASQWTTLSSNIYFNTANVGVGTSTPAEKLSVSGNIALTGNLKLTSDTGHFVNVKAPASLAADLTLNFPGNAGSNGYALTTDGAGNLSWSQVATTASAVGGDLTGTVANASIASGAVTSAKILDGTIVNADVATGAAIAQSKIANLTTDLAAKENTITAGTTAQYWRGDKSWQPLSSSVVPEGTNLYFLDSRVRAALLSGYTMGTALPVATTDTLLEALGKLEAQIVAGDTANSHGRWLENGTYFYYNANNVGIGTSTPGAKLEVAGQVKITGGSPGTGKILMSDASGLASWVAPGVINGTLINITNVTYGASGQTNTCGTYVQTACNGKTSCSYTGTNTNCGGDPANGVVKYITVDYACGSKGFSKIVAENTATTISCSGQFDQGGNSFGLDTSLGLTDNFALSLITNNLKRATVTASGNFGVGTTTPTAKLEVAGQIRSVNSSGASQTNASASVDWNNGNAQSMSVACTATTFTNMLDGASYTLAVTETSATTCVFSHTGLTFYYQPANASRISGQRTLYSFRRIGTDVYVTWSAGFQ